MFTSYSPANNVFQTSDIEDYGCFFLEEPRQAMDNVLLWSPGWPHILHTYVIPSLFTFGLYFTFTVVETH